LIKFSGCELPVTGCGHSRIVKLFLNRRTEEQKNIEPQK
jgi:hypothetical protein